MFEAVNDSIKEAEEKFKLLLKSNDPNICFCRDLAHVAIEEDPNDGNCLQHMFTTNLMALFISL